MALEPARGHANAVRRVSRGRLAFWSGISLALGVVLFFLLTEHRAHLLGALPWVVLVLCPIAMYLMMRGHPESRHGARGGGS